MSRLPIPHFINQIKTKLGFDRTLTASGEDVVDAVNKQSQQIGTLDGRVDNSIIAGSKHTLSVGGTISQQTISCPGMTANHRVGNWGLSTGSIQNPPAEIEIVEGTDEYTLTVSNVTTAFNFTPIFILPQN